MRKKLCAFALGAMAMFSLVGCGAERSTQMKIDIEKQVTKLANYKEVELTVTGDFEVSEEEITQNVVAILGNFGLGTVEVTDRDVVQDGDYVNVDYTGYDASGEAFSGGAATDTVIDVTNNLSVDSGYGFIEGFTKDLPGAKVGEEISSKVTFPENYGNESLNGQTVTFVFKINSICRPVEMADVTDKMVVDNFKENYGFENKTEFVDYIKSVLEANASTSLYDAKVTNLKQKMMEESEYTIPEQYLNLRLKEYEETFISEFCGTETLESYLSTQYGVTVDEARKTWKETLESQIATEFIFGRIAQIEGLELDEEGYQDFITYIMETDTAVFPDESAVYSFYGMGNAEEGEKYLRNQYLVNKAVDFVLENANITVNAE